MASMHASESLSLASCSARARRLFSRASHSASTRRPKRSSKARAVMSASCCCSVHAAAMAASLSAWSFSSVGAGAGGFKPLGAVALGEPQDAEARAIALLGMRTVREDRLDQRGRLGADGARPIDEARRRPLEVALVGLGHVGGVSGVLAADDTPPMRGDARAA